MTRANLDSQVPKLPKALYNLYGRPNGLHTLVRFTSTYVHEYTVILAETTHMYLMDSAHKVITILVSI